MTFDELMQARNGKWEDGVAVIQDQGGFFWRVATGSAESYQLTSDGRRILGVPASTKVAYESASKVESPKRRKAVTPPAPKAVIAPPPDDTEFDLDDDSFD